MPRWYLLLAALLIGSCAAAVQPDSAAAAPADEPPPLIAGRVSAIEGDVRIWRAEASGQGAWDRADLNDVVSVGTGLSTGEGRTEVRVGPHAFRLGAGSTGGFDRLDFAITSFGLGRGVLSVTLAPGQQSESVSITVADVQIELAAPGRYRVDAIDGAPLTVAAFEGEGAVRNGGHTVTVSAGQALKMTQSSLSFVTATSTALDAWALERDERYARWESARFVSPNMTGYEELGAYGDWVTDPTYGTVWYPRTVPVGWAPYRFGRWRWVAPWGWTWVDAAPWGYAPFHYGRWITVGGRWCWWPGGYVAQPVWAPALVGFVGSGTSVSIGFGGPVVGWYPLAPWHPYRPYYRTNASYVTVINQTVIQHPPPGVRRDLNQRPGSTWVPQQRFHEPVVKVRIPAQTEKIADLRPVAPPPRPVRTAPRDDVRTVAPTPRGTPPHSRTGSSTAQTHWKFGVDAPQPLPGADTRLTQPAPSRAVPPRQPPAQPRRENDAPRPQPHVPAEIVPPYQQLQKPFPAEPARTPPAAPPTVRPPAASTAPHGSRHGTPPPAPTARVAPPGSVPQTSQQASTPSPGTAPSKQDAMNQTGEVRAPRPDIPRPKTSVMER